ncbi:hypothetical protein [Galbibacter sp. BG1]
MKTNIRAKLAFKRGYIAGLLTKRNLERKKQANPIKLINLEQIKNIDGAARRAIEGNGMKLSPDWW